MIALKESDVGEPYQIQKLELAGEKCVLIETLAYEVTVNCENIIWKLSKDDTGNGVVILDNRTQGSCAERYAEIFASEEKIREYKQKLGLEKPMP